MNKIILGFKNKAIHELLILIQSCFVM